MSLGLSPDLDHSRHCVPLLRPRLCANSRASSNGLQFPFGAIALPSFSVLAISHCGVCRYVVWLFAGLHPLSPLGLGLDAQRAYIRPRLREGPKLHITRALVAGTQEVPP